MPSTKRAAARSANRIVLATTSYPLDYREATARFHRKWLTKALQRFEGNISETARHMGLTRRALQLQTTRLGIDLDKLRNGK